MKGLSILFTISLFVFAAALGQLLRHSGALPTQLSEREKAARPAAMPLKFVNYRANNPHHLN